ncbi:hypothetical protein MMC28_003789 [Mycoblastus sanguinarius]|nr:hypothetical protein [Mycoblastus sanguinarius]
MPFSSLFSNKDIPLLQLYSSRIPTPYQTAPASPDLYPPRQLNMTSVVVTRSDSFLALSRQEAHLQDTLQYFLDAQSEGLLAGLAGGPLEDEALSTSSRTSTPPTDMRSRDYFQRPKSVVPVRQPVKRKLGLWGARRGIARAIFDLAVLKGQEESVLENELLQQEEFLHTVRTFERKCTGLEKHINDIQSAGVNRWVENLKVEEKGLGKEIREMETKLWEMKAKQRNLLREIERLSNGVQSKLSSYESALSLAQNQIRSFLSRPPIHSSTATGLTGIWSLPAERRTLEMARDQCSEEQEALKKHILDIETERVALEEGAEVWNYVIQDANAVEKLLREEMQKMQPPLLEAADDLRAAEGMKRILEHISRARSRIESKLAIAEDRKWKLLICCIGAELEAMIEGQSVLQAAIEASQNAKAEREQFGILQNEGGQPVSQISISKDPVELGHQVLRNGLHSMLDRSEDDDDGPGPELLISHHDDE